MTAEKDYLLAASAGGNDLAWGTNSAVPNGWDTLRAQWAAQAKMDFAGYSNMPVGAISLTNPGGASRAIKQRDASGQDVDMALDVPGGLTAPNLLSRTVSSPQNMAGHITGSFDSLSAICNRLPQAQGLDFNNLITAGYGYFASGNDNNFNEPPGSIGGYGVYIVCAGLFCSQTIYLTDGSLKSGRIYSRTWYAPSGPETGVWREILTNGNRAIIGSGTVDDGVSSLQALAAKFSSLTLTSQPTAYLKNSVSQSGGGTSLYGNFDSSFSSGASLTTDAFNGLITVNETGWYIVEQDFEFNYQTGYTLTALNFKARFVTGFEFARTSYTVVSQSPASQPCGGIYKRIYLAAGTQLQAGSTNQITSMSYSHKCKNFFVRKDADQSF